MNKEVGVVPHPNEHVTRAIERHNEAAMVAQEPTADQIKARVGKIQEVMRAVMQLDVHYGTIPGTPRPALYKPGAEKLLQAFSLGAEPIQVEDLSTSDVARYRVTIGVFHIHTGQRVGAAIGECSSNEEKYKWRKAVSDREYDATPQDRRRIKYYSDREVKQVRTEPADQANTILKMAEKRAFVGATIRVTAASDIFEQDLEDLPDGTIENQREHQAARTGAVTKKPSRQPQKAPGNTIATAITGTKKLKDGTKNGKNWTLYKVDTADGEFTTFSRSHVELADEAQSTGQIVRITFKEGERGRTMEEIELSDAPPLATEEPEPKYSDEITKLLSAMNAVDVTEDMILGKYFLGSIDQLTDDQIGELRSIYKALKAGETVAKYFPGEDDLPF